MKAQEFENYRVNMKYDQPIWNMIGKSITLDHWDKFVALRELSDEDILNLLDNLTFYYRFFRETQTHLDDVKIRKATKKRYNDTYRAKKRSAS